MLAFRIVFEFFFTLLISTGKFRVTFQRAKKPLEEHPGSHHPLSPPFGRSIVRQTKNWGRKGEKKPTPQRRDDYQHHFHVWGAFIRAFETQISTEPHRN